MVEENPSITLKNIKMKIIEFTNVSLSTTSIFNALKVLRITLKIATINVGRMNCISTIEKRQQYVIHFSQKSSGNTRENSFY